jgi:hypothetical protein
MEEFHNMTKGGTKEKCKRAQIKGKEFCYTDQDAIKCVIGFRQMVILWRGEFSWIIRPSSANGGLD